MVARLPCYPVALDLNRSIIYTLLMNTHLLDQARQLSVQDQIELVTVLWDDIAKRSAVPLPTETQKMELDRRLADHEANPDDVLPWDKVKVSALAHIGRWASRLRSAMLLAQNSLRQRCGMKGNVQTSVSSSSRKLNTALL